MDLESVVKLRKIEAQLVEDVDFESISPGLLQYKVISNEEWKYFLMSLPSLLLQPDQNIQA